MEFDIKMVAPAIDPDYCCPGCGSLRHLRRVAYNRTTKYVCTNDMCEWTGDIDRSPLDFNERSELVAQVRLAELMMG